ncbi:MAG: Pre-mRNA-splicing factor ATP-dependent RNA helicase PRP16 [Paramarteilia canceri]
MHCATAVDGEWLAEYGNVLYSMKHGNSRDDSGYHTGSLSKSRIMANSVRKMEEEMQQASEEMKREQNEEQLIHESISERLRNKIVTPGKKSFLTPK